MSPGPDPLDVLLSGLDAALARNSKTGVTQVEVKTAMLSLLVERLRTHRAALREISKLGSVCQDFGEAERLAGIYRREHPEHDFQISIETVFASGTIAESEGW